MFANGNLCGKWNINNMNMIVSLLPLFTPCLKKTVQNCVSQNFVNFPPILVIFGRKMAKRLKLSEVHSFSTSPNLRHHTTLLNADVPNCYKTL